MGDKVVIEHCPHVSPTCKYFYKCPPEQLEDTQMHGCYSDTHELNYPESTFQKLGSIAWAFRMHPRNRVQICRQEHDQVHANEPYSQIPHKDYMARFLVEHHTESYITPRVWRAIDEQLQFHSPI